MSIPSRGRTTVLLAAMFATLVGSDGVAMPVESRGSGASAASGIAGFGQLPLAFEKNLGQADARFQYFSRGAGHSIYLNATESVIALENPANRQSPHPPGLTGASVRLLRFSLVGADRNSAATGVNALAGRLNYISGSDANHWRTGIPVFGKVRFARVYPGIDLVYYGTQGEFEYDFVVSPGANPNVIAFQVEGADRVELSLNGDLVISAGTERFHQRRPVVHQDIGGHRRDVPGRFVLDGSNLVSFELGRYDRAHELVIDPVLSLEFSTLLGSSKTDRAWAIAADSDGNTYVAGDTLGVLKQVPATGFQTNFAGGSKYGGDAFVAKLDATGTNFVYFTYLGGDSLDGANGLAVDAAGAAYVTGFTISTNFPVHPAMGAFQPGIGGTNIAKFNVHHADAFVTKLDAVGLPVYSTYLGGEVADVAAGIAVDSAGSAYVAGYTDSALVFRVTNEVRTLTCTNFNLTNLICGAEVVRTNVTTARLLVASQVATNLLRLQISGADPATTNEVVSVVTTTLLGSEKLTDGFPIANAIQTNNAGGADIFVAKLNPDGGSLAYATYLGGAISRDFATGIGVDASGQAIVSGVADEGDFPVTNALQSAFQGGRDAIVAKLDAAGSGLIYSTYLGGSSVDIAYGLAVDGPGSAFVVGSVASRDFLSTAGRVRPGGVSKSTDGGTNWTLSSAGLTHTGVRAFALNPAAPSTLYAATPRGVFLSTDAASTWAPSISGPDFTALLVDPLMPATVYASAQLFFKSEDSGFSWSTLGAGLPNAEVRSLVLRPAVPEIIYAGTSVGFYVSSDAGTNFVRTGTGLRNRSIHQVAVSPLDPELLYAATDGGVYQSTNNGLNWRAFNTGLATRRVLSLVVNPSNPETLVAGTARGVFRSENSGTNWMGATNGIGRPFVNRLAFDPSDSAVLYAGCSNGVFKSIDGGVNWAALSTGLLSGDTVALAVDPSDPTIVYAGARGTNFSGGTNDAFLVKLSPDGTALEYGFTFGGSRTDEARSVAVDTNGSAFVTGLTLSRNFPVVGPVPGTRWQGTNSGKTDVFIAQFDPTGSSNVFAIHLGGKRSDSGHAIALDGLGGIYVAGATDSRDFPTTNAVQAVRSGEKADAFITKLTTNSVETAVSFRGGGVVIQLPPDDFDLHLLDVGRGANPQMPSPAVPQSD